MDKNYILHKFLNGEASSDEIAALEASPEYRDYIRIARASEGFDAPNFDSKANFDAIQAKKIRRLQPPSPLSWKNFMRIAAVFAVLATGFWFLNTIDTSVSTQIAEKKTFNLPDNSVVQLNSNSEVVYNKSSWNKARALNLKGEAYFKVEKGSKFDVNTPNGVVSVVGTEFNVFTRDSLFRVKCFEGLVHVSFNDTLIKLPAGNFATIVNNSLKTYAETAQTQPDYNPRIRLRGTGTAIPCDHFSRSGSWVSYIYRKYHT